MESLHQIPCRKMPGPTPPQEETDDSTTLLKLKSLNSLKQLH